MIMKAVILAAGEGTRLKKYTRDVPKGMLLLQGKTLIERQIEVYRECGINQIIIVRGFAAKAIDYESVTYYENSNWRETNMVASLVCARAEFNDAVLVSYADLCFSSALLASVIGNPAPTVVAVDSEWQDYWKKRYGRIDVDTESLRVAETSRIIELGKESPPVEEIDGRYIGVVKFSPMALAKVVAIYDQYKSTHWDKPWQQSKKPFRQAYMTDLLQELIDQGEDVVAQFVERGWLEFDTNEDYELQKDWRLPGAPTAQ